jgi:hypothetical protein
LRANNNFRRFHTAWPLNGHFLRCNESQFRWRTGFAQRKESTAETGPEPTPPS